MQNVPETAAPACHGRPMRRDGQQHVCDHCGAWTDLRTEAVAAR
jgi:hypothetical protein